jgi:hypothetical protein
MGGTPTDLLPMSPVYFVTDLAGWGPIHVPRLGLRYATPCEEREDEVGRKLDFEVPLPAEANGYASPFAVQRRLSGVAAEPGM